MGICQKKKPLSKETNSGKTKISSNGAGLDAIRVCWCKKAMAILYKEVRSWNRVWKKHKHGHKK